jgi:hypothetical protein
MADNMKKKEKERYLSIINEALEILDKIGTDELEEGHYIQYYVCDAELSLSIAKSTLMKE